jgi:hypothetical protein
MRSWQASIGTALLLVAVAVGAYALWRRGGASQTARPAPATQQPVAQQPVPAQVLPAQQPQPTPLAPEAQQVLPTPDPNAYPMAGNAAQPYYVPPAATNNIPPQSNIPKELTVVSESGAPTPDDSARAKRNKPDAGDASAQPSREGDDSKTGARGEAADRNSRTPDPEARPTPRPTPPTPAPSSNPEHGKVIQWPPQ